MRTVRLACVLAAALFLQACSAPAVTEEDLAGLAMMAQVVETQARAVRAALQEPFGPEDLWPEDEREIYEVNRRILDEHVRQVEDLRKEAERLRDEAR